MATTRERDILIVQKPTRYNSPSRVPDSPSAWRIQLRSDSREQRSNAPLRSPGADVVHALATLGDQDCDARAALPLVNALLFLVSDALTTKQPKLSKSESLYASLLQYLEDNCQHSIDRQSVSEKFKLHPNSVSRIFRVHGHESFNTVLTHLRMRRAKILRSKYRLSMKELSAACGFRDPNYFGRVFRRWSG